MSENMQDDGPRRSRRVSRRPRIRGCVKRSFDYKEIDTLRGYLTEHGRIRPRRQTGLCASSQRSLARAVKRARHIALLPFVVD